MRKALAAPVAQQVGISKQTNTVKVLGVGSHRHAGPPRELCVLLLELTGKGLDMCYLIKHATPAPWAVNVFLNSLHFYVRLNTALCIEMTG